MKQTTTPDQDSVEMQNEQAEREMRTKASSRSPVVDQSHLQLDADRHLLVCLAEECAEVIQAVSKALRFGLDDDHQAANPAIVSPRLYIAREIADLDAVYGMLQERGVLPPIDGRQVQAKCAKLAGFMEYAQERGTLTANPITQPTASASERDVARCKVCGWPLAATMEEGCVEGNCSMRPVPRPTTQSTSGSEPAPAADVSTPSKQDYDAAYEAVEQTGLGVQFRSCSCGQLPCAKLRPIAQAIANARVSVAPDNSLAEAKRKLKAEEQDHLLTIETFRQQERIWNQKMADFRDTVVRRCREAAEDWIARGLEHELLNSLADEFAPLQPQPVIAPYINPAGDETKSLGSVEEKNLVNEG